MQWSENLINPYCIHNRTQKTQKKIVELRYFTTSWKIYAHFELDVSNTSKRFWQGVTQIRTISYDHTHIADKL